MRIQNHLPENLLFLRESANLIQADIQNRLGIVRNTWSNWENGKTEPGIDNLLKIAHFFNINVGKMITDVLAKEEGLEIQLSEEELSVGEGEYPEPCAECAVKERIIQVQNETISALQGQVDVLQLYLSENRKTGVKNKQGKK